MRLTITIIHGEMRLLFTGDIETARTESCLASSDAQHCQLIKMPRHGSMLYYRIYHTGGLSS
jgi:beta-lactamase superfamily II metal-dependent hydrolase